MFVLFKKLFAVVESLALLVIPAPSPSPIPTTPPIDDNAPVVESSSSTSSTVQSPTPVPTISSVNTPAYTTTHTPTASPTVSSTPTPSPVTPEEILGQIKKIREEIEAYVEPAPSPTPTPTPSSTVTPTPTPTCEPAPPGSLQASSGDIIDGLGVLASWQSIGTGTFKSSEGAFIGGECLGVSKTYTILKEGNLVKEGSQSVSLFIDEGTGAIRIIEPIYDSGGGDRRLELHFKNSTISYKTHSHNGDLGSYSKDIWIKVVFEWKLPLDSLYGAARFSAQREDGFKIGESSWVEIPKDKFEGFYKVRLDVDPGSLIYFSD